MSQVFRSQSFHIERPKTIWTPTVIASTVMMLVSGTCNTVAFKYQSDVYNFKHGFVQTSFMFIGEFMN
jgi:hypothetical protein